MEASDIRKTEEKQWWGAKGMIKKIKWKGYASLGNLELDFTKTDGTAYNTVVLAGENGTGKTTILKTLSEYLNGFSMEPFEFIEYEAVGVNYHIVPDLVNSAVGFHQRAVRGTEDYKPINSGRNNNEEALRTDPKDLRSYGFAYSKARSGFNTGKVTFVTTEQVDTEKYESDDDDDFTRIKQLIIDIEQQDDAAWRKETNQKNISDQKYKDFERLRSKGQRFKKAFNSFFDNIKYVGVNNENPHEKQVMFEKHGRKISIDQLSTGEKQIVFRGAHLLKNINSIIGGTVLIDEPELSMHPIWQREILRYYRELFLNDGKQSVQMIIATHSEYVLQSALKDRENILIVSLVDNNGIIEARRIDTSKVLPSITAAETSYLVFNVLTVDYHIELYGFLQTQANKYTVKECDDYIAASEKYDSVRHSKPYTHGSTNYQTLPTFIRNVIDHPDSGRTYTDEEFKISVELLIELCKELVTV